MIVDTTQTKIERDVKEASEMTPMWFGPLCTPQTWKLTNKPDQGNMYVVFVENKDDVRSSKSPTGSSEADCVLLRWSFEISKRWSM